MFEKFSLLLLVSMRAPSHKVPTTKSPISTTYTTQMWVSSAITAAVVSIISVITIPNHTTLLKSCQLCGNAQHWHKPSKVECRVFFIHKIDVWMSGSHWIITRLSIWRFIIQWHSCYGKSGTKEMRRRGNVIEPWPQRYTAIPASMD